MSDLRDYKTGEYIREATAAELVASTEAARHDGGAGVIEIDYRSYYVVESLNVPSVEHLGGAERCPTFYVCGAPEQGDWKVRDGSQPWCKVSIWDLGTDRPHVGSFGGEVWPAAWPGLFRVGPRTTYGQSTHLTPRGVAVFRAALAKAAGEEPTS